MSTETPISLDLKLEALTLVTRDVERARTFYSDKLGLPVIEQRERSFVVDLGGLKLRVDRDGRRSPLDHAEPRLLFHTDRLGQRCAGLRDQGISVDGPRQSDQGCFAELADPDGHPIVLWEG